ncbi:hypothetical protein HK096_011588 [Nowakowskiella sp. JEL0078]|nr:hypothetical protein HK096_011588 [Nowakowskiella sp. JEL0078]
MQIISNYLPDDSNPDYSYYESTIDSYRHQLEARYPPLCSDCAPRVQSKLEMQNYLYAHQLRVTQTPRVWRAACLRLLRRVFVALRTLVTAASFLESLLVISCSDTSTISAQSLKCAPLLPRVIGVWDHKSGCGCSERNPLLDIVYVMGGALFAATVFVGKARVSAMEKSVVKVGPRRDWRAGWVAALVILGGVWRKVGLDEEVKELYFVGNMALYAYITYHAFALLYKLISPREISRRKTLPALNLRRSTSSLSNTSETTQPLHPPQSLPQIIQPTAATDNEPDPVARLSALFISMPIKGIIKPEDNQQPVEWKFRESQLVIPEDPTGLEDILSASTISRPKISHKAVSKWELHVPLALQYTLVGRPRVARRIALCAAPVRWLAVGFRVLDFLYAALLMYVVFLSLVHEMEIRVVKSVGGRRFVFETGSRGFLKILVLVGASVRILLVVLSIMGWEDMWKFAATALDIALVVGALLWTPPVVRPSFYDVLRDRKKYKIN